MCCGMTIADPSSFAIERRAGTTTNKLIDQIMALRLDEMDADTLAIARMFLADTLVTGVAGVANHASNSVLKAAQGWDGGREGDCAILGRPGLRLSPHSAAMLNGFQIHCLEWDGLHEPSVVIALCAPMAAILSEAQTSDAGFEEVLFAFCVGVEIAVLFGAAAAKGPRFFRPSTAGLMGAAAALGVLRKFDRDAMTRVLGLAYSQVSGTMQAHWEGSEALPMQIGIAARAALTAADLAVQGLTAPHDFLDGKFGYFSLIEASGDPTEHIAKIAQPWKIIEIAHKPFPAGRATQATLTALMDMQLSDPFTMEDVTQLTVHVPPLIMLLVGRPYGPDMEAAYARLCLPCIAPMMIRHGRIDPRRFTSEHFGAPQALFDASKIHVELDGNTNPNALSPQRIEIEFSDGRAMERIVDAPFGSPSRPMTRRDQITKAQFCLEVASFEGDPRRIFDAIESADATTRFAEIVRLVTEQEGPVE